jgi:hypothetical protein
MSDSAQQSPVIWRCSSCGSLVHPSDHEVPVAWCSRCRRISPATRDGGDDTSVSAGDQGERS